MSAINLFVYGVLIILVVLVWHQAIKAWRKADDPSGKK